MIARLVLGAALCCMLGGCVALSECFKETIRPENVASRYPKHWGKPPSRGIDMDHQIYRLPHSYGWGSRATLRWVEDNITRDGGKFRPTRFGHYRYCPICRGYH